MAVNPGNVLKQLRIRPMVITAQRVVSSLDHVFARVYPQAKRQSAPKTRIDITAVKVLVHISCAVCHTAVI
ncbi:hypothetical protein D3C72_1256090 [compost metagenome]